MTRVAESYPTLGVGALRPPFSRVSHLRSKHLEEDCSWIWGAPERSGNHGEAKVMPGSNDTHVWKLSTSTRENCGSSRHFKAGRRADVS